nr:MAG TPA: hypothetical protein [Caudoviricetes sp.]
MDKIIYVTSNFIQELGDEVITSSPEGVKLKTTNEKAYSKWLITNPDTISAIDNFWKQFVPTQITVRQLKLQLLKLNLLDKADALVKSDKEAQIEFEYAKDIEMNSPLLQKMAKALGLDDDGVLKFFDEASKL